MQSVALDPFAAIEQPAERPDGRIDLDLEAVFERMHCGHLVGDGADPADAGNDVDDLVRGATDDQLLEIAGCLEDLEVGFLYDAVPDLEAQRALAFDPGQSGDVDAEIAGWLEELVCVMHRSPPACGRPARVGLHGRR